MKAVIYERYGPPEVLHLTELAKPTPNDNEVLVKVRATTVTIGDSRMRSFTVPRAMWLPARLYLGIRGPRRKVLGMELAGDVKAVGSAVTRFKPGEAVFASTFSVNFGGYAEYKCFPEDGILALKPSTVTYEEAAAAVGGGIAALKCLRKADIQPGQRVLIYGASGAVGTNAVQIACHHFGADVTAVCGTRNLDMVRSLGASTVIDYTQEDFTQRGEHYDVVFDAVAKFPASRSKQALTPAGTYINVHKDSGDGEKLDDLMCIKNLLAAGTIRPVIDRCYPLEEIVEAHRYVDSGHKQGNVVISLGADT